MKNLFTGLVCAVSISISSQSNAQTTIETDTASRLEISGSFSSGGENDKEVYFLDAKTTISLKKHGFTFLIEPQIVLSNDHLDEASALSLPIFESSFEDPSSYINLTSTHSVNDGRVLLRLNQLGLKYETLNQSLFVGRKALTWGNGKLFHALDLFRPRNPSIIESQYKLGVDAVFFESSLGNNLKTEVVFAPMRGHVSDELTSESSTIAARINHSGRRLDTGLSVARYLEDTMIAVEGVYSLKNYLMRADISLWDYKNSSNGITAVIGIEGSKYVYGEPIDFFVEYFHTSIGENNQSDLSNDPLNPLVQRIQRSDTYLTGKNYLGGGLSRDLSLVDKVGITFVHNLGDHSSFMATRYSHLIRQNIDLQLEARIPIGSTGDEFGAIQLPEEQSIDKSSNFLVRLVANF